MKCFLIILAVFFTQLSYGQLKGAVPQKDSPENIKVNKEVEPTTPAGIAKKNAEKLSKSLKLNEKQQKELYAALLEYETNIDKTQKSKLTNKEKYVKSNELNRVRQKKLKIIFSKEQYNTYIMSFP